eukprot:15343643-Ditylum_brightwellii.AAC.1
MSQVQILIGLLAVEMQVKTCFEEASGSAESSGHSTYMMHPCCMDYRSRYLEQSMKTHASVLDPA